MYNKLEKKPLMECNGIGGSSVISTENNGGGSDLTKSPAFIRHKERLEKVGSYSVGKCLGRGNFAIVRAAYHETVNAKVAIKIVNRKILDFDNNIKIEREIKILQKLSHPFIVKLFEVIRTENFLYIVTEFVENGELFTMLTDKGRQTEDESRRLFQQIVSAVFYCHSKGIVHRDLKAENLLIDSKGNIKLIDFGFSNFQKKDQLLTTWCGSPPYAAPELLLAQEYDGRLSDVWSLGVILYILVTGGFPFPGGPVDKLKHAVLNEHLKIPFWVSVECSDLIRKMLTVSLLKRYSMQNVIQHRWFTCKMPKNIFKLLNSLNKNNLSSDVLLNKSPSSILNSKYLPLDPTVLIFLQQHTRWTEDQITEEVLSKNYFSPIFATYEIALYKLNQMKDAEGNSPLQLDTDNTRRGSRGSIISGKANVDPEPAATIPAYHLAKLSLAISRDYDSDNSSNSDLIKRLNDNESLSPVSLSMRSSQQQQTAGGKAQRRRGLQGFQEQQDKILTDSTKKNYLNAQSRRHTLCTSAGDMDQLSFNSLLSAQPFVDKRALANAAAAAAIYATQLQQQNQRHNLQVLCHQQQQTALDIASLHNFPFDYAQLAHFPNQERRASANEALLGLNSYAHLFAACSTMVTSATAENSASIVNNCSPIKSAQTSLNPSTLYNKFGRSVEDEGETYLSQQELSKRNTAYSSVPQVMIGFTSSSLQRHAKTPYAKQNGIIGNVLAGSGNTDANNCERRSSWASTTSSTIGGLNISPTQQAQLESFYKQSIASAGNPSNTKSVVGINFQPNESLAGIQQLQIEFQKLCALTTKSSSQGPLSLSSSYNLINSLLDNQKNAPTISITDENNQSLLSSLSSSYNPLAFLTSSQQKHSKITSSFSADANDILTVHQKRPATAIGFSSNLGNNNSNVLSGLQSDSKQTTNSQKSGVKFIYVPVSIVLALERLEKHSNKEVSNFHYEAQPTTSEDGTENDAMKIRVTHDSGKTILEITLFRMSESPNISKAIFGLVQGQLADFEHLKSKILSVFNEVY